MRKINFIFLVLAVIFGGAWLFVRISNAQAAENNKNEVKKQIEENINIYSINSSEEIQEETVSSMEEEVTETPKQFGALYEEGETFGLISYFDNEASIVVGNTSESLKNNAMLSPYSTPDAMVILGHCYQDGSIFGKLYLLKENDSVSITEMDGTEKNFTVRNISWVTEEHYNSKEGIAEVFDGSSPLKLVTCMTKEGVKGRLIISLD